MEKFVTFSIKSRIRLSWQRENLKSLQQKLDFTRTKQTKLLEISREKKDN
jgi:glutathionylspermidine synthase